MRVFTCLLAACLLVPCFAFERESGTVYELPVLGKIPYPMNTDAETVCDFATEPCAPLNDVWAYNHNEGRDQPERFAVVGVANGVDFVDVNVADAPERLPGSFIPGCITMWRDIKSIGETVYVVNDATPMCRCYDADQRCENMLKVEEPASHAGLLRISIGSITTPLTESGPITGELVAADPFLACTDQPLENAGALAGKIALVGASGCFFGPKILAVQAAGAIAVVIVNDRDDIIYPSMNGKTDGITIPGGLVGQADGGELYDLLARGTTVTVTLDDSLREQSTLYQPPNGLWVLDASAPDAVELTLETREWFDFAHNIVIDPSPSTRPYLYVCGMDTHHGGLVILDLHEPLAPTLASTWDTMYIHDLALQETTDGRVLLYGACIYDDVVYVIDVTDPTAPSTVMSWDTHSWPHNVAISTDNSVLFLTHEETAFPVTMWDIRDLDNVREIGQFSVHEGQGTIPHNAIIVGDLLWLSYYSEGVAVYDISNPGTPVLLALEDTSPRFTEGFHGVWGIYPVPDDSSDIVYASDIEEGFHVLQLTPDPQTELPSFGKQQVGTVVLYGLPLIAAFGLLACLAVVVFRALGGRTVQRHQYNAAHMITSDLFADHTDDDDDGAGPASLGSSDPW